MSDPQHIDLCRHLMASVAAGQLDRLPTSDRIMICEGIASVYPSESREAVAAREHADALRSIEQQQLLLTDLLKG
jgi:hypothetical protein